jgi:hypothetical protein
MKTEAEFLTARADERVAACADLESDILIRAIFERPQPLPPMRSPLTPGAFFRRQAE